MQCQNERSQHKNRATAWKMLRARMARMEEEKREAAEAAKYQQQAKTGFGSQIRNYFLHPDQRVKDARTKYGQGNFHAVMDGDIQGFLDAVLRWRAGQPVEESERLIRLRRACGGSSSTWGKSISPDVNMPDSSPTPALSHGESDANSSPRRDAWTRELRRRQQPRARRARRPRLPPTERLHALPVRHPQRCRAPGSKTATAAATSISTATASTTSATPIRG